MLLPSCPPFGRRRFLRLFLCIRISVNATRSGRAISAGAGIPGGSCRRQTSVGVSAIPARMPAARLRPDARRDGLAAAVALEALEVEAERSARAHRCGSSVCAGSSNSESWNSQKRPWRAAASAAQASGTARGCFAAIAKWRNASRSGEVAQPRVRERAARAGVVAVEDDERRPRVAPHVVAVAQRRSGRAPQVAATVIQAAARPAITVLVKLTRQARSRWRAARWTGRRSGCLDRRLQPSESSPSKIRFAPGSSPGLGAW